MHAAWSPLVGALCGALALPLATSSVEPEGLPRVELEGRLRLESLVGEGRELALLDLQAGAQLPAPSLRVLGLRAPPAATRGARVEVALHGGERLAGRLESATSERLELELFEAVRCALPIDQVARLSFPERLPRDLAEPLAAAVEGDRIYLRVGQALDRVDGTLLSADAQGIRFESELGQSAFAWDSLSAVFLEALGPPGSAPETAFQRLAIDLIDGSRVRARLRAFDRESLDLELAPQCGLRLPWSAVSEVLVEGAGLVFLSDLQPLEVREPSPFGDDLGLVWPHRVDRAVGGSRLSVGGRIYQRGLGVHAPSELTYDLGGRFRSLRGSVGVDDEVLQLAARGSVEFRVEVDGQPRWSSAVLRGGEGTRELGELDLSGASRLKLSVDVADQAHVADRADWLRLLLVEAR